MRLLIMDGGPVRSATLAAELRSRGHQVRCAPDGLRAIASLGAFRPDAFVIDAPGSPESSADTVRLLRSNGNYLPVVVLADRVGAADRIDTLDAGADLHLTTPVSAEELTARLRALLRRSNPWPAGDPVPETWRLPGNLRQLDDLLLSRRDRDAARAGRRLQLSRTEFALLALFVDHHGEVLDRGRILEAIWGRRDRADNVLDVYVGYLRTKLEADGGTRLIHTIRGVGFVLRVSERNPGAHTTSEPSAGDLDAGHRR